MHSQGSVEPQTLSRSVPAGVGRGARGPARADRLRAARWTGSIPSSPPAIAGTCASATCTPDGLQGGSGAALGADGLLAQRARRPAAGVGDEPARPQPRRPRLRSGADGALLRPRRCARASASTCTAGATRARSSSWPSTCASATPACGSSAATPPPPAAHRRGAHRRRRGDQPARAPMSCGSGSACPSRRSGWPTCARSSTPPCSSASARHSTSTRGSSPRHPSVLQESGLEWAYRLAHEPRRLWRRYLRYNPRFVHAFTGQLIRHRRTASRP